MKLTNLISSFIAVLFLVAPGMSLLALGYHADAENTVDISDLKLTSLIAPDREYRDDIIDGSITNSPVGINAVRYRNLIEYNAFGYVETDQVISGNGRWLFYIPSFNDGECTEPRRIEWAIDRSEALKIIAEAAGIEFLFSVSPDKALVAQGELGIWGRLAAGCKIQDGRAWRKFAKSTNARLVDHLEAMQTDYTSSELYFLTDTHWRELGGALALRQIARIWLDRDISIPRPGSGIWVDVDTDLLTGMLRAPRQEVTESFPDYWRGEFAQQIGAGIPDALIIHDSFYKKIYPQLQQLFPGAQLFDLNHPDPDGMRSAIAQGPKYLLVNSVERRMIPRLVSQNYSWNSPLGKGLIDANERLARQCDYRPLAFEQIQLNKFDDNASADSMKSLRDPKMYFALPDQSHKPCLKISFRTTSTNPSQLFLPVDESGGVREGKSVIFYDKLAEDRSIEVVLPRQYAGTRLRFDPDAGDSVIENFSIEVGSIASPD